MRVGSDNGAGGERRRATSLARWVAERPRASSVPSFAGSALNVAP
jgi:hypothetical protein